MDKIYFNDLLESRQLNSMEDVKRFDGALENLSTEEFSKEDIKSLLSIFTDQTKNEEVMFGLLHLIENNDDDLVIDALIGSAPEMNIQASDWLDTFIFRTINNETSKKKLIHHLNENKKTGRDEIVHRLQKMKDESSEKIRENASFVLSNLI